MYTIQRFSYDTVHYNDHNHTHVVNFSHYITTIYGSMCYMYSHVLLLYSYLFIYAVCIHLDTNYDFIPVEFTRKFKEVVVYNKMSRNILILSLVMSY